MSLKGRTHVGGKKMVWGKEKRMYILVVRKNVLLFKKKKCECVLVMILKLKVTFIHLCLS